MEKKPPIICLCGSGRFAEHFIEANRIFTLAGYIVLSIGVVKCDEKLAPMIALELDELHLRKIDLADEVHVLNIGGYIGESTKKEIQYAKAHGKRVTFKEPLQRKNG